MPWPSAPARRHGDGDARRLLSDAVRDSVRHHLVADVPVAVFLSAGLDSGALLGTMAELWARNRCRPSRLAFAEFKGLAVDEAPLAAEVAQRYGARHIVRTVDRAEFERDLPAILDAMDLPTIDGINTWFVAKAAHEAGIKVALSGLGADECFGGYPSFADVPRSVHWLRPLSFVPGLGALVRRGLSAAIDAGLGLHPKAAGLLQYGGDWAGAYLLRRSVYMPWELDGLLDPALVADGLRRLAPLSHIAAALHGARPLGDFDRVAALETALYMRNQLLRDADWAGMSHGVEIRVPYVDPFFLAALPPGDVLARVNAKDAVADVPRAAAAGGRPRAAQDRLRDAGRPLAARGRRYAGRGHAGRRRGGFLRRLAQLGAARMAERLDDAGGGLTPDDRPHPGPGRRRLRRARRHRALQPRPVRPRSPRPAREILVLPRLGDAAGIALPAGVRQRPAMFGRLRFSLVSLWTAWRYRPVDVVFCGHVLHGAARRAGWRACWARATGCRRTAPTSGTTAATSCAAPSRRPTR